MTDWGWESIIKPSETDDDLGEDLDEKTDGESTYHNFSWETRNQGILWQDISHKKNRQEKQEIDKG